MLSVGSLYGAVVNEPYFRADFLNINDYVAQKCNHNVVGVG